MSTEVIRAECDKIDMHVAFLQTDIENKDAEIATKDAEITAQAAQILTLEQQLAEAEGDCPEPQPVTTLPAVKTMPVLSGAPIAGVAYTPTPAEWVNLASPVKINWYTNNSLTSDHDGTLLLSDAHVDKTIFYEEVATVDGNSIEVKVNCGKLRPASDAPPPPPPPPPDPDPEPDPDPTPDPEPDPDPIPDPEPTPTPGTEEIPTNALWFRPEASGSGDGSSPENAMAISRLSFTTAPGRVLALDADVGVWPHFNQSFSTGGADGAPCSILGAGQNRIVKQVVIRGDRPNLNPDFDPEWPRGAMSAGGTVFNLNRGAHFLRFGYMFMRNINYGFRVLGTIKRPILDTIDFHTIKEGLWMDNDPEPAGSEFAGQKIGMRDFLFRKMRFDGCEIGFRIFGSSFGRVEGIEADMRRCQGHISELFYIGKGDNNRDDTVDVTILAKAHGYSGVCKNAHDTHFEKPYMWFASDGTEHLLYAPAASNGYEPIRPVTVERNLKVWNGDTPGTDYWNGDIVVVEKRCHAHIEDLITEGCTDTGFDIKGSAELIRCVGRNNKRNFRFHGENGLLADGAEPRIFLMEDCLSEAAFKRGGSGGTAHVHVQGGSSTGDAGCVLTVRNSTFRGSPGTCFHTDANRRWGIKTVLEGSNVFDGVDGAPLPHVA
jgi:hypothetical protein